MALRGARHALPSLAVLARAFSVSIGTPELGQGRRTPDGPARVLLTVIDRGPEAVRKGFSFERAPAAG